MQYKFLNIFLDPKELLVQSRKEMYYSINPFLLENSSSQIEKVYEFYKSNISLLFVNGFVGTGKAALIDYSTNFLSEDTVILKYKCFNSTILDDILLSFFYEFKNLASQGIIAEPKIKSENFTQKINAYFSQIEKSFVIILNSFESILDENRQEIIDFITHLNSMPKIKIIITGRVFEKKYFPNTPLERITTLALDKEIFYSFMKSKKIKASNLIFDEFFKNTRGYYFFTALSLKIIQNQNISLVDYLTNLKNSYLSFDKFLEKEALTLISGSAKYLFWFLSIIRHPISVDLLKKLGFYEEEQINLLLENLVLTKDGNTLYINDFIKENIDEVANLNISQRIRYYLIDLYNTQLPLKPFERNICISRQTMRKEIEFHKIFLPKKPKELSHQTIDIGYLTYSNVFGLKEKQKEDENKSPQQTQNPNNLDLTQRKNIKIDIKNLPYQATPSNSLIQINNNKDENLLFKDLLILIRQAEKQYNYPAAIELCLKALSMKNDEQYQIYLPLVYTKLANAYKNSAEYEKAIDYYEKAQIFYEGAGNLTKINFIKFQVAKLYYETYKVEKAKELLLAIVKSKDSPSILIIKAYLILASLEEDSSTQQNAFEYYKKALEHESEVIEPQVLSELYFKYALVMDDKNDIQKAIEFYNKCLNISQDHKINKFLSSAYSNIAALYSEKNDIINAIDNYTKAYNIDEQNNNLEGVYYSASHLASILQNTNPEESLKYYKIALQSAEQLQDSFYSISATLAIGDYHYDINQNEMALKYYIKAYDIAQGNLSKDNIYKIDSRINDIKFKLGIEKFENLVSLIRGQQ